eukprot:5339051-Amphidinium_carterae.1
MGPRGVCSWRAKAPKEETADEAALAASKRTAAEALGLVSPRPFTTRKPGHPSATQHWQNKLHNASEKNVS